LSSADSSAVIGKVRYRPEEGLDKKIKRKHQDLSLAYRVDRDCLLKLTKNRGEERELGFSRRVGEKQLSGEMEIF